MSIKVMTKVWEHSQCKGSALLLLLAIADFADDEGVAWPSIETLSGKIRMSPRQTKRIRQSAIDAGELEILEAGGGRGKTDLMRILINGDKMTPFPDEGAKPPRKRVTNGVKKGDKLGKKGDIAMSPDPLDPSIDPEDGTSYREPAAQPEASPPQASGSGNAGTETTTNSLYEEEPLAVRFRRMMADLAVVKGNERVAIVRHIFAMCYGEQNAPPYAYVGKTIKRCGSASYVAARLMELSTKPPDGDVLAYIWREKQAKERRYGSEEIVHEESRRGTERDEAEERAFGEFVRQKLAEKRHAEQLEYAESESFGAAAL